MLAPLLASRAAGRIAITALALGVAITVGLADWGTSRADTTVEQLQKAAAVDRTWHEVFLRIVNERMTLRSYLLAPNSPATRQDLADAANGAREGLDWLEHHGDPQDVREARLVSASYTQFTALIQQALDAKDHSVIIALVDQSSARFKEIQQVISDSLGRLDTQREARLAQIDHLIVLSRQVALGVGAAVILLCLVCAMFLLAYQRRAEREAAQSRYKSQHDSLTGLANRDLLVERAEQAIADASAQQNPVGLLLLDLDRFKLVNDALGHQAGDEVLQKVAERLEQSAGDADLVARLGGDEFAVLLRQIESTDEVRSRAERVRHLANGPLAVGDLTIDMEASVGSAVFPEDAHSTEELVKHADVAMYVAKRSNLGVCRYSARHDANDPTNLAIPGELRAGLERGELVLHYQPKVETGDLRPVGVEALVRWQHPTRGLLSPGAFLPIIEPTELIEELTKTVLGLVATQMEAWSRLGIPVGVAMNVPPRCLLNIDFPDQVGRVLREHSIDPNLLTLEVTETALISFPELTAGTLRRLHASGIRSSIDDFGTGYSSLASLRNLPLQELKIDRSFVKNMLTDDRDCAIVDSTIHLARRLDLTTVAEGVEDAKTLTSLRRLGCPYVQGYHIGRPMVAGDCESWLTTRLGGRKPAHSVR